MAMVVLMFTPLNYNHGMDSLCYLVNKAIKTLPLVMY
jgi:hypothetical protein